MPEEEKENTESTEKENAELTEKELKQIENRRKQTVTILKYGTLKDGEFWAQDYVDTELFFSTLSAMNEINKTLRESKADKKIEELKALGVVIPANFKLKFSE